MSRPRPRQATCPNHLRTAALAAAGLGAVLALAFVLVRALTGDTNALGPEQVGATESALAPSVENASLTGMTDEAYLEMPVERVDLAPNGNGEVAASAGGRRAATSGSSDAESGDEAAQEEEVPIRWIVEGSLSSWTRIDEPWELATVMVARPATDESVSGTCERNARFRIDVSKMAERAEQERATLTIRVDHPSLLAQTEEIPAGSFSHPTAEGERIAVVPFHLDAPSAFVTGKVRAQKTVQVGLFQLGAQGRLGLVDQQRIMPGNFRLRVPQKGLYWFAAVSEGMEPATASLKSVTGGEVELTPIRLRPGMEMGGTALLPGRQPARGAVVVATPADREFEPVGFCDLGFDGQRFTRMVNRVQADDDGRFEFLGLSHVAHFVTIEVAPDLAPAAGTAPPERIEPPPPALEVFAPVALVEFLVTGDEGPLRAARIQATWSDKRRNKGSDERGKAELLLPADTQGWALVSAKGHAPKVVRLETPAPGVKTVKPVRLQSLGEGSAELVLMPKGHAPESVRVRLGFPGLSVADERLVTKGEDGNYVLSDLYAGVFDVRISDSGEDSYWMPHEAEVDVSGAGSTHHVFSVERGGRMRFEIRGGTRTLARMDLAYLGHKAVPFALVVARPNSPLPEPGHLRKRQTYYLEAGKAFETFPNLPPGKYVLDVRATRWRDILEFEVVAGETTLEMLDLPREAPRRRR